MTKDSATTSDKVNKEAIGKQTHWSYVDGKHDGVTGWQPFQLQPIQTKRTTTEVMAKSFTSLFFWIASIFRLHSS